MDKPTVALMYDFDGTLSPDNMQEYDFMKAIKVGDKNLFWNESMQIAQDQQSSTILSYMKLMIDKAKANGISIRRQQFVEFGKGVVLFPGVEQWFDMVNSQGSELGVKVEHYIISSGLKELIEGTSIAHYFKKIYACSFMYENGSAVWPAVAVDFTSKTQFIFMINKGIYDIWDNARINDSMPDDKRPVPFQNMIYLGDGETDIPSMRVVKSEGGHSIAIYKPGVESSRAQARNLVRRGRVNFACAGDYTEGSELHRAVIATMAKIKTDYYFHALERTNQRRNS
ncbi:MAG: haloacid dehalogenase-like hydrolase [Bacteroidaceae bacterium]|nr:haloacid dehalogenase-like hydrolase [Bacteroidaceae bacterium]